MLLGNIHSQRVLILFFIEFVFVLLKLWLTSWFSNDPVNCADFPIRIGNTSLFNLADDVRPATFYPVIFIRIRKDPSIWHNRILLISKLTCIKLKKRNTQISLYKTLKSHSSLADLNSNKVKSGTSDLRNIKLYNTGVNNQLQFSSACLSKFCHNKGKCHSCCYLKNYQTKINISMNIFTWQDYLTRKT